MVGLAAFELTPCVPNPVTAPNIYENTVFSALLACDYPRSFMT